MNLTPGLSASNRERKWIYFKKHLSFDTNTKILDVGFNNFEYRAVDNYLEKIYPFLQNITALGIDGKDNFQKISWYKLFYMLEKYFLLKIKALIFAGRMQ